MTATDLNQALHTAYPPAQLVVYEEGWKWTSALRVASALRFPDRNGPSVKRLQHTEIAAGHERSAPLICVEVQESSATAALTRIYRISAAHRWAVALVESETDELSFADRFRARETDVELRQAAAEMGAVFALSSPRSAGSILSAAERLSSHRLSQRLSEESLIQSIWRRLPWQDA